MQRQALDQRRPPLQLLLQGGSGSADGPLVALANHLAHGLLVEAQTPQGNDAQQQRQRQDGVDEQLRRKAAGAVHGSVGAMRPRATARITASVRVAAWSLP